MSTLSRFVFRLKSVAAGGLVIVACAPPPGDDPSGQVASYPRAPGTERMAERLEALARDSAPGNPFASSAQVEVLLRRSPGPELQDQLNHRSQLAEQLLNAGRSREAATEFNSILRFLQANQIPAPGFLQEQLAISYLRMGLEENCPSDQAARRCSVPVAPDAIHSNQTHARRAIEQYRQILANPQDELTAFASRWLLNLAYMAVGEHPSQVPEEWLIPAEALRSEHDIKPFPDVAPRLGLDVTGRAGGSVMDDFDADGDLDIMASSWGLRDQLRYFRNNGDGTFADFTMEAGLEGLVGGLNLVQADYNNDGFLDVLVLRGAWLNQGHPDSLLRNNGDGTFADVTEEAGLLAPSPGQTAAWGDFDNDGWVDLFIGAETQEDTPYPCRLFRNNGDGTFTDIAAEAGVATVGFVKAVVWGDYDNDNRLDLYVSRRPEPNLLFHNEGPSELGPWSFQEVAADAGVQEPLASFPTWFFDYDNDGWLDIFVAGYAAEVGHIAAEYLGVQHSAELPRLYRNNHDGTFADVTRAARVDRLMYAMGANYGDLDNDGFLDFYVGTGDPDPRMLIPNRMFRNAGGQFFQDVTASGGFGHLMKGHGVSFGDIDHDGDQDMYTVLGGAYEGDVGQNALFVNPGHGNSWITLRLQGVTSNRAAIGARVKITVATPTGDRDIHATVSSGGSFGASSLQQEIGLGRATAIRTVAITWPATGTTDVYDDVSLNRAYRILEGDPTPTPVTLELLDLQ